MNRKISFFILQFLLAHPVIFAYQLELTDSYLGVYKEGKLKEDSSKYVGIYELDDSGGTLTEVVLKDINRGETIPAGSRVYEEVKYVTKGGYGGMVYKKTRKYSYVNSKTGSLEIFSLCEDGTYIWTAVKDSYVNISHGIWRRIGE